MARLKYYNSSTQTWEYADNVAASTATDAVLYVEQSITDQQKEQARKNISAASSQDVGDKNQLQTEDKTDLVSAINELYNREDQVGENPLPEYTEEDYGKVLSPTEDGLTWKEIEASSGEGTEVFIQAEEPADAVIGDFWWDTDEEASGGGGAAEIPYFNLSEMGLPNVPLDGTEVNVETDTTAFREALANGQVKIKILVRSNGVEITDIVSAMHIGWSNSYVLSKIIPFNVLYLYEVAVSESSISACVHTLQTALPDVEEGSF